MTYSTRQHKVVLTYGSFDRFDQKHSNLLRQVSAMGDELIVGCTSDEFAKVVDLSCVQTFDKRRTMLEHCRFVSRVISHETADQLYTDIINYNVSLLVMCDVYAGQFDELRDITKVCYLPDHGAFAAVSGASLDAAA